MKKILFIDRDGVLIEEPDDQQIDQFQKLKFTKNMLTSLSNIAHYLDYELVMVTNQDGLGSVSFPEKDFWPIQEFLLQTLQDVGVFFSDIHIDRSFEKDRSPYRKPGTAMLTKYLQADYDLEHSFVIGDRMSDMQLAANLGCKGIRYNAFDPELDTTQLPVELQTDDWKNIETYLLTRNRNAQLIRNTNETSIQISINLDGHGQSSIATGLPFFDHMLDQMAKHSGVDLFIQSKGDLHIDEHHTMEDTGIAFGEILHLALAKKTGLQRYGFALPMDDCRSQVLLDFGGRSDLVWEVDFQREKIGDCPTEMFQHFFKSVASSAKANIHIKAYGQNEHHKIESIFKAFARAMKTAIKRNVNDLTLPTTKGMI